MGIGDVFAYSGTTREVGYSDFPKVEQITEPFLEFRKEAVRVRIIATGSKHHNASKYSPGVEFTTLSDDLIPWDHYTERWRPWMLD